MYNIYKVYFSPGSIQQIYKFTCCFIRGRKATVTNLEGYATEQCAEGNVKTHEREINRRMRSIVY
jgi:hypothetical protein